MGNADFLLIVKSCIILEDKFVFLEDTQAAALFQL